MGGNYGHLRYALIVGRSWKVITGRIVIQEPPAKLTHCWDFLKFDSNLSGRPTVFTSLLDGWGIEGAD